jgi:hypothetical protein
MDIRNFSWSDILQIAVCKGGLNQIFVLHRLSNEKEADGNCFQQPLSLNLGWKVELRANH